MPALELESAVVAAPTSVICPGCGGGSYRTICLSRTQMLQDPTWFRWVTCEGCGLVYLNPPVAESAIGKYYEDYLPHRGPSAWGMWAGMVAHDQEHIDRARFNTLRKAGPLSPESSLLDVGCGRPSFLRLANQRAGCRAVGTDVEPSGWASGDWSGLELHAGRLEELELRGPFDRITLWHTLEHLYRPVETLRYLRRLATPGAVLIIEVPDHEGLTRRWHGGYWAGYHTPRHLAAYTPATLRSVIERGGWKVTDQYQWGTFDPYLLWWLGRQEQRGRSFSGSLQSRFLPFLAGKIAALPLTMLERWIPMGFQTAIAIA